MLTFFYVKRRIMSLEPQTAKAALVLQLSQGLRTKDGKCPTELNRGAMYIMTFITLAAATAPYTMAQPYVAGVNNHHPVLARKTRQVNEHRVKSGLGEPGAKHLRLVEPIESDKKFSSQRTKAQLIEAQPIERGSGRLSPVKPVASRRKSPSQSARSQVAKSAPFRLIAFGSRDYIMEQIKTLYHLGYAEPTQWSKLQHSGRPGEFLSILTVRGLRDL